MTLGEFRKITKDLRDDVRLVVQGTTPNDISEQYDVAKLLDAPEWSCGTQKAKALLFRTIRCEARLSQFKVLGE